MSNTILVQRVEALTERFDSGLSENAIKALQMARSLNASMEDYTLPTVQTLETFKSTFSDHTSITTVSSYW